MRRGVGFPGRSALASNEPSVPVHTEKAISAKQWCGAVIGRLCGSLARGAPEWLLAAAVSLTFLVCLGALDLWGKREQMVACESLDTLRHGHWLVAQMRDEVRLKKPPLTRWLCASAMWLTGSTNEFSLRLPAGVGAIVTIGVTYYWGRRIAGRECGLAAAWMLTTTTLFVVDLRQASPDSMLVPWVTLAVWCFWRAAESGREPGRAGAADLAWSIAWGVFAGLGVLTKGPVALLVIAAAAVGYVRAARPQGSWRPWPRWPGWLALVAVALPWPLLVVASNPQAGSVWWREITLKVGGAGESDSHSQLPLCLKWVELTMPWVPLTIAGLLVPFRAWVRVDRPIRWLLWSWCVTSLFLFSGWQVAKLSYFLPCLPAVALLGGLAWCRLREQMGWGESGRMRRLALSQWGLVAAVPLAAVVATPFVEPAWFVPAAGAAAAGFMLVILAWRCRGTAIGLPTLALSQVVLIAVATTACLPQWNARYSHKSFAQAVAARHDESQLPVWYVGRPNQSLWFYLHEPPAAGGTPVDLVTKLARTRDAALVVLEGRELRQLAADSRVRVTTLLDETQRPGKPGLALVRVRAVEQVAREGEAAARY
jgi:4-amino-4-deoxy-L-arabinose transferase-like glycosyltransferase